MGGSSARTEGVGQIETSLLLRPATNNSEFQRQIVQSQQARLAVGSDSSVCLIGNDLQEIVVSTLM